MPSTPPVCGSERDSDDLELVHIRDKDLATALSEKYFNAVTSTAAVFNAVQINTLVAATGTVEQHVLAHREQTETTRTIAAMGTASCKCTQPATLT